ncbi:aldehyde dehydrogenase family protein [Alphaproteobacteria bacterium]|nr:aldehyde dehydrogenase family protein [Alphaproteobacteria bacterium]
MSESGRKFELMIPGASTSAPFRNVFAPFDGAEIASVAGSDKSCVEKALSTAHRLFRDRNCWLSTPKRIEILEKTSKIMSEKIDDLALEAAREGGKPLVDSIIEVQRAISSIEVCIEVLKSDSGSVIPMNINAASLNRIAMTRPEPIGVVVAVSAFNHPLNLIVHQVGPAVACGCPVIVKPAEDTPISCIRFVEILREAGLPEEWCQVTVTEDLEAAQALVTDSRVGFFSFIGSPGVGWKLRSLLAPGARCALEHGGAAPLIVAEDANMDLLIPNILKGGFYHAGQVCVSVQRVFAHKTIIEELTEKLSKGASELIVGDPTSSKTEVGPLIRKQEVDRVSSWVDEAKASGAVISSGGNKISDSCYAPTVIYKPSTEVNVSKREIFGPVVCLYSYDDLSYAITQANSLPFSFQASVFTQDIDKAMSVYSNIDASAVMINDHTAFRVDWMPFAGSRQSGHGVGGIPYTIHEMQTHKMMVLKSPAL